MRPALPDGLVDAARAGNEGALLQLLVACRPDLTRYARRACRSDDVEEAVQDALWLLYRRVGGLRTGAALSAWMFQVVRHLCFRYTRSRATRDRFGSIPLTDDLPGADAEDGLRLDMVRAIGELPPSYRNVLIMRDIGGFEASEVAAELGITVEATKSRLHRARGLPGSIEPGGTLYDHGNRQKPTALRHVPAARRKTTKRRGIRLRPHDLYRAAHRSLQGGDSPHAEGNQTSAAVGIPGRH